MKCTECGGELEMKVERTGKRNYDGGYETIKTFTCLGCGDQHRVGGYTYPGTPIGDWLLGDIALEEAQRRLAKEVDDAAVSDAS